MECGTRKSQKSSAGCCGGDWASAFAVMRIGMGQAQLSGRVGGHTADNVADGSRSTAVRGRLGGSQQPRVEVVGQEGKAGQGRNGRRSGLVERLKDDARVDWSRMACQSVSSAYLGSVGRASVCLTPATSAARRAGWWWSVERGAGGLTSRMRPRKGQGTGGRVAGSTQGP